MSGTARTPKGTTALWYFHSIITACFVFPLSVPSPCFSRPLSLSCENSPRLATAGLGLSWLIWCPAPCGHLGGKETSAATHTLLLLCVSNSRNGSLLSWLGEPLPVTPSSAGLSPLSSAVCRLGPPHDACGRSQVQGRNRSSSGTLLICRVTSTDVTQPQSTSVILLRSKSGGFICCRNTAEGEAGSNCSSSTGRERNGIKHCSVQGINLIISDCSKEGLHMLKSILCSHYSVLLVFGKPLIFPSCLWKLNIQDTCPGDLHVAASNKDPPIHLEKTAYAHPHMKFKAWWLNGCQAQLPHENVLFMVQCSPVERNGKSSKEEQNTQRVQCPKTRSTREELSSNCTARPEMFHSHREEDQRLLRPIQPP